jgi:hypothetical protein
LKSLGAEGFSGTMVEVEVEVEVAVMGGPAGDQTAASRVLNDSI